jgi:hypothetical protein
MWRKTGRSGGSQAGAAGIIFPVRFIDRWIGSFTRVGRCGSFRHEQFFFQRDREARTAGYCFLNPQRIFQLSDDGPGCGPSNR